MVSGGVEMVVSAMRNPDFELVLAIGSGGVMIELLEDIRYLATPCDPRQIRRAIDQLRGKRILEGFRGAPATDIDALVSAVLGVAALAQAQGLAEIEINPLIVLPQGQGAMAVDCIMRRSR
jgi:succinyl-CoA synthetase beta subunit